MKNLYLIFDRETESNDLNRLLHFVKKNNVCNNKIACTVKKRTATFKITCKIIKSGLELTQKILDTRCSLNVHFIFNDEYDRLVAKERLSTDDMSLEYVDRDFVNDKDIFLIVVKNLIKKHFHIGHVIRDDYEINVYRYTSENNDALLGTFNDRFDRYIVALSEDELTSKIKDKLNSIHESLCRNNLSLKQKIQDNNRCKDNITQMLSKL